MRTVSLAGRDWPLDIRVWESAHRREASLAVLAASAIVLLVGVVLWFVLEDAAATALTAFIVVLAVLAAFELAVHVAGSPRAAAEGAGYAGMAGGGAAMPRAAAGPRVLTLKCGDCATVFDLEDPGTRPLYHTCPGCGAEGVLSAPPPEEAAPVAVAPVPVATPRPVRRLKLRCGACQTVFVLEDRGDRPLRHECPGCGRAGELK